MNNSVGVMRKVFLDFDQQKVRRNLLIITLLLVAIFAYSYYTKVNPINVGKQQLPFVTQPTFLFNIYGTEKDPLKKPMAVVEGGRRIYVSDSDNHRIQVFDYEGNPVQIIGQQGSEKGQFQYPYGLAIDTNNQLYVADITNKNISVLSSDGQFLKYLAASPSVEKPAGLCISDNRVYVADVGLNKVLVLDLLGNKIGEIGTPGTQPGQLRSPNAVSVYKGKVYVSDTGNDRVQVFNQVGQFVSILDGAENPGGQSALLAPRGVAIDQRGTVYVVNNLIHSINAYDQSNKKLFTIGSMGKDDNQFYLPVGLCIDTQGRIYVTDTVNQRIDVYQN